MTCRLRRTTGAMAEDEAKEEPVKGIKMEECFSTSSILMPFTSGSVSSAIIFSVGSDTSVADARVGIAEVERAMPT